MDQPDNFRHQFVDFALRRQALRFGEFTTKAGRQSPYFFNSGMFCDGASLRDLARFYAQAALASGIGFDMLFGPAYKGITLASAMAVALAEMGHNLPYSFNRKEAKDHGEGGLIVGSPLSGRVLIVDDVISDGASKRESVEMIRAAGATPVGVLIALDRQERGADEANPRSASQEFKHAYGVPVIAVATLDDIVGYLESRGGESDKLTRINAYRRTYGAAP